MSLRETCIEAIWPLIVNDRNQNHVEDDAAEVLDAVLGVLRENAVRWCTVHKWPMLDEASACLRSPMYPKDTCKEKGTVALVPVEDTPDSHEKIRDMLKPEGGPVSGGFRSDPV